MHGTTSIGLVSPVAHEGSEQHHQSHDLEPYAGICGCHGVSLLVEAPRSDSVRDAESYIKSYWPDRGCLGRAYGSELVAANDIKAEDNMNQ
jgi:hypothetical protein